MDINIIENILVNKNMDYPLYLTVVRYITGPRRYKYLAYITNLSTETYDTNYLRIADSVSGQQVALIIPNIPSYNTYQGLIGFRPVPSADIDNFSAFLIDGNRVVSNVTTVIVDAYP